MTRKVWAIYAVNAQMGEMRALRMTDMAQWADDALELFEDDPECKPFFDDKNWFVFAIDVVIAPGKENLYTQLRRCLDGAEIPRMEQAPYIDAFRKQWLRLTSVKKNSQK